VLRACKDLLRPGGRMAFYTIFAPSGLRSEAYDAGRSIAPWGSVYPRDYREMLRAAAFVDIEEVDSTAEYLHTLRAWIAARKRRARALRRAIGEAEFTRIITENEQAVAAVQAGVRRRSLFVGRIGP